MAAITEATTITEARWVKQAFFKRKLGGAGSNSEVISKNFNFYDTTLGGNRSMNPPPQHTRFSDIKLGTIAQGCKSMGNYYKEAYDDNAQRVSLQFGIPRFNSLSAFLANFYDRSAAELVNYGVAGDGFIDSMARGAGNALGTLFTLPIQTYYGLNYVWNRIKSTITGNPYSKFYYMEPQMASYWSAVSLMFNKLAVDTGALDFVSPDELGYVGDPSSPDAKVTANNPNLLDLRNLLPDVVRANSDANNVSIDVKALSSRSQRLANRFAEAVTSIQEEVANENISGEAASDLYYQKLNNLRRENAISAGNQRWNSMTEYLKAYKESPMSKSNTSKIPEVDQSGNVKYVQPTENPQFDPKDPLDRSIWTQFESMAEYFKAELMEGSAFVTFNVDKSGPVSHSFSSTTKEAPLKEAANSISQNVRDMTVNFAGGNIGDDILSNIVETGVSAVGSFLGGLADSVKVQGVGAVLGGALMDMPDVYADSSAELNQTQYKLRLQTPYGNKYSILTRIYLPLCMLLAGALPRATGKGSYGPPFLCRLHSQGFEDIRLGMISNLNIELGTSNIGRSVDGLPTAVDVTFTVESMDKMMIMPLTDSILQSVTSFSAFDEDTVYSDFLGSLAGTDLSQQYYMSNRIKRRWKKTMADWNSFGTPAYWAQWFSGTPGGKAISAFMAYGDI
jgi:hypothetical protein